MSEQGQKAVRTVDPDRRGRGRPVGAVARTTRESRKAIALFVEQNLPRLDNWLLQVANGLPKVDREGEPLRDSHGSIIYVVKPDPATAIKCLTDTMEYHLPRLSRSEASVVAKVESSHVDINSLNAEQLQQRLLISLGLVEGNVVDADFQMVEAEPVEQAEPAEPWMK